MGLSIGRTQGGDEADAQAPRERIYGPEVLPGLRRIWAVLDGPAGKRLAPFMVEIVPVLERCGELG